MIRISREPGMRGDRPYIRGLRITIYGVLSMASSGLAEQEILEDFPELAPEDILAVPSFAADREQKPIHWRCNEAVAGREFFMVNSCRFSSTTTLIVLRWFCWGWNRHPSSLCGKPTDFRMRPIVLVSIPGEPLNYSSRQGTQGIPLLRDITCCAASPWRKQGPVR